MDCKPAASGKVSDSVKVTGKFGEVPGVSFGSPLSAKATERTVVIEGKGDVVLADNQVDVEYSMYSGETGEAIVTGKFDGTDRQTVPLKGDLFVGFLKTLECSTTGSRVVGTIPPADGFGPETMEANGLSVDDTLVLVVDVVSTGPVSAEEPEQPEQQDIPALPKADGADQPLPTDFPKITVKVADDETGTPTVTLPGGKAPAELEMAVLKKGTGPVVASGVDVVLNYQGLDWETKEIFDQSWGNAEPATFSSAPGQLIEGFTGALVGQTVGSQVLVVIPPALAYGEAGESEHELAGKTLVFLIDILGAAGE